MNVLDACDELATLFEPDPTLRDDHRARPLGLSFEAETFYLWPRRVAYTLVSQGYEDEERFIVGVAWAAERASVDPEREVTDAIVARATAVRDALARVAGQGIYFDQAHVDEVDHEALLGLDWRGFVATISGYHIRSI